MPNLNDNGGKLQSGMEEQSGNMSNKKYFTEKKIKEQLCNDFIKSDKRLRPSLLFEMARDVDF